MVNYAFCIRISKEKQLQEAAKTNEEAQAVINQLKASLQQLENRFRQARTDSRCHTTNGFRKPRWLNTHPGMFLTGTVVLPDRERGTTPIQAVVPLRGNIHISSTLFLLEVAVSRVQVAPFSEVAHVNSGLLPCRLVYDTFSGSPASHATENLLRLNR